MPSFYEVFITRINEALSRGEPLNELSPKTLGSYVYKATRDVERREAGNRTRETQRDNASRALSDINWHDGHSDEIQSAARDLRSKISTASGKDRDATWKKNYRRGEGIHRALNRLGGETPETRAAKKAEYEKKRAETQAAAQKAVTKRAKYKAWKAKTRRD